MRRAAPVSATGRRTTRQGVAMGGSQLPVGHAVLQLTVSSRGGTRTPDPAINSRLLYQLSYSGIAVKARRREGEGQRSRWSGRPAVSRQQAGVIAYYRGRAAELVTSAAWTLLL